MGGLAIAKVDYYTWVKFATKLIVFIFIASVVILSIGPMILGLYSITFKIKNHKALFLMVLFYK